MADSEESILGNSPAPDTGESTAAEQTQAETVAATGDITDHISDAPAPWYSGLPQEMHEKFKDMSAEDAAKVFERGSGHNPSMTTPFLASRPLQWKVA